MKVELVSKTMPKKDITSQRFGRLTVMSWLGLRPVGTKATLRSWWNCLCDCGKETNVMQTSLTSGNTKSCGCSWKEAALKSYKGLHHGVISSIMNNYVQSSKKRGSEFLLLREEFEKLIRSECYYCKCPNSNIKKSKNSLEEDFLYNGIDRVDNNLGYTSNNVVPCCKTCNFMKKDMPQNEFIDWIKRVYESRKW